MKFSDKILILPIIILATNFLYRLYDFSSIITRFPLDITNDLTGYLPDVIFFGTYGFFGHVPIWYNGFTLFNIYPPAWVLFTFPIYKLTNQILLAAFLSAVILILLGFIATWLIGKEFHFSWIKRIALFLFIYANPMSIGAIFKQGRLPSLLALTLMVFLFYLCIYFKDRELNYKSYAISITYALLILTHQTETVLASTFILGLFLVKKNKEKLKILWLILLSLFLSSFWWIHFIQATKQTGFLNFAFGNWLLNWSSFFWSNFIGTILSLSLFFIFFLFYKQKKEKEWMYFFLPILIFNFLYITRLVTFIPIIKYIYPDPWQDFLMLNAAVLFLALNGHKYKTQFKKAIAIILILASVLAVAYNLFFTPFMYEWGPQEKEAIALLPYLEKDSHFLMFNEASETLYSRAIYSYAAIYHNISSSSGWFEINKEYTYVHSLNTQYKEFMITKDCTALEELHDTFNTTEILANGEYCESITQCGWITKKKNGSSCILSYSSEQQQK